MIRGIDISHQNDPISWLNFPADIKFIYAKATQGAAFKDPMFPYHWGKAKGKNILHGAYHFLTATDSAQSQADNFLSRGVDWKQLNVLPPMLDIEDQMPAALNKHITDNKAAFVQLATDWLNIVTKETGRIPVIYSYKNFFAEYLNNHAWPNNPLWLASYQATPPGLPKSYGKWDFWQYSDLGQLNGSVTGGSFDLDYFNGSIVDLRKL